MCYIATITLLLPLCTSQVHVLYQVTHCSPSHGTSEQRCVMHIQRIEFSSSDNEVKKGLLPTKCRSESKWGRGWVSGYGSFKNEWQIAQPLPPQVMYYYLDSNTCLSIGKNNYVMQLRLSSFQHLRWKVTRLSRKTNMYFDCCWEALPQIRELLCK